jgi:hypothetical protein
MTKAVAAPVISSVSKNPNPSDCAAALKKFLEVRSTPLKVDGFDRYTKSEALIRCYNFMVLAKESGMVDATICKKLESIIQKVNALYVELKRRAPQRKQWVEDNTLIFAADEDWDAECDKVAQEPVVEERKSNNGQQLVLFNAPKVKSVPKEVATIGQQRPTRSKAPAEDPNFVEKEVTYTTKTKSVKCRIPARIAAEAAEATPVPRKAAPKLVKAATRPKVEEIVEAPKTVPRRVAPKLLKAAPVPTRKPPVKQTISAPSVVEEVADSASEYEIDEQPGSTEDEEVVSVQGDEEQEAEQETVEYEDEYDDDYE